jgi:hypothetical protein
MAACPCMCVCRVVDRGGVARGRARGTRQSGWVGNGHACVYAVRVWGGGGKREKQREAAGVWEFGARRAKKTKSASPGMRMVHGGGATVHHCNGAHTSEQTALRSVRQARFRCLSVCLLSVCLSAVCLSVCLSACPSVCLCVCVFMASRGSKRTNLGQQIKRLDEHDVGAHEAAVLLSGLLLVVHRLAERRLGHQVPKGEVAVWRCWCRCWWCWQQRAGSVGASHERRIEASDSGK